MATLHEDRHHATARAVGDTRAHRPAEVRGAVRDRFVEHKITPEQVRAVLEDGGDSLYAAANSRAVDWADRFGGPLAVAWWRPR
jgi:hypothetical protein